MPWRRAVSDTRRGPLMLSRTIRRFSSSVQRRRRPVSTISSRPKALCVWLSIPTVLNDLPQLPQGGLRRMRTDSDAIRSDLEWRGIDPVIPTKANRKVQLTIDNTVNRPGSAGGGSDLDYSLAQPIGRYNPTCFHHIELSPPAGFVNQAWWPEKHPQFARSSRSCEPEGLDDRGSGSSRCRSEPGYLR